MSPITVALTSSSATSHVPLAALGYALRRAGVLAPLLEYDFPLKHIDYAPADKLTSGLVLSLAGGRALYQANWLLRPNAALARAWGLGAFAEQSTISDTFDALGDDSLQGLREAFATITQTWSQTCHHDFRRGDLILDGDLTGLPASRHAEGSQKGYFAGKKNRYGRQLARVTSQPYGESLGSLLFPGSQKGQNCLEAMVLMAEQLLALPAARQRRLLWRLDGGFGTDAAINWLLPRQVQILVKGFAARRAAKVARDVPDDKWIEVGPQKWVAPVPNPVRYARRTATLAVEWITLTGKEKHALLIHQLFDQDPASVAQCYNARGGMETEIREDKAGLQLVRRRKHAWNAQAAWVVLNDLAHNLIKWTGPWMRTGSTFETFGTLRIVQDLLSIPGRVEFGGRHGDRLVKVALQRSHPYAAEMQL